MEHSLRLATPADSAALLAIYGPYVRDTAISFETEIPTVEEFAKRIADIAARYPYLVYQVGDEVAGYAYAGQHRSRAAYAWDVDVSIYVAPAYQGTGVAQKLYDCLFALLARLGYVNVYAAYTSDNGRSGRFHQKCGFGLIGTHHKTGYKFGRWYDVTWLEKSLPNNGDGYDSNPPAIVSIQDLPPAALAQLLAGVDKKTQI